MINIGVFGSAGCGKSRFVNEVVNPEGKGKTPVPSKSGPLGVSNTAMRFVKRSNNGHNSIGYDVIVVSWDYNSAVQALQEAFNCATKADLQTTVDKVYNTSITELLACCSQKLQSAARVGIQSMDELADVISKINTLCLPEKAKATSRRYLSKRIADLENEVAVLQEKSKRRVSKNFSKEEKAALLAELPGLVESLVAAKADQEENERTTEPLPLGEITRYIEIHGDFAALPANTALIDAPVSVCLLFVCFLFCFFI